MRHTIVIEFDDSTTSHQPDAVERAVTKAIQNCPSLYDPSVWRIEVVEYHHEQMTATYAEGPDGEDYNDVYHPRDTEEERA